MGEQQDRLAWVGTHLLPHEPGVRRWLRASLSDPSDVADIVQETYCRIWTALETTTISNPRAYFYQVARNVVIDQRQRARVVRIEAVADIEQLGLLVDEHSPERILAGRNELARLMTVLDQLPHRARQILEMRKVLGLSQREIGRRLGVSENVVENDAARALRHVIKSFQDATPQAATVTPISPAAGGGRAQDRGEP